MNAIWDLRGGSEFSHFKSKADMQGSSMLQSGCGHMPLGIGAKEDGCARGNGISGVQHLMK
jgi:hypothetical protein